MAIRLLVVEVLGMVEAHINHSCSQAAVQLSVQVYLDVSNCVHNFFSDLLFCLCLPPPSSPCPPRGIAAGLLNVLVAAGPRLLPNPASRLYATTMLWTSVQSFPTLRQYLEAALGGTPESLPSLLGLRLVTETRFGSPVGMTIAER
jgi:hypothetical protein